MLRFLVPWTVTLLIAQWTFPLPARSAEQRPDSAGGNGRRPPGFYPAAPTRDAANEGEGFGRSENRPRRVPDAGFPGELGKVSLVFVPADQNRKAASAQLLLINRSESTVRFAARDSQLYLCLQAQDTDGKWVSLEGPPRGTRPRDCGNSYHRVPLNPGEYWRFSVKVPTGQHETRFRYVVDPGIGRSMGARPGGTRIVSEEFPGTIDPQVLSAEKPHWK